MYNERHMEKLILYDYALSGNCHKVRLLLSMLDLDYLSIPVNLGAREQKSPWFLKLNPRGQVPVLVDKGEARWDSSAILVYLARRYDEGGGWFPDDLEKQIGVLQWMALAQNEILYGLARARAAHRFNRSVDMKDCIGLGQVALGALERRLDTVDWLADGAPTLADIACYPYVALAHEGEISLKPYPAVTAWLERFERLPGWRPMEGVEGWRRVEATEGLADGRHTGEG